MVYRGKVKNGVVVLQPKGALPDGTEVIVQPVQERRWMKHIGKISDAEAKAMLKAIEETCERVDLEGRL